MSSSKLYELTTSIHARKREERIRDREKLSKRASNCERERERERERGARKSESEQEIIASKRNKQTSMKQLVDQQEASQQHAFFY